MVIALFVGNVGIKPLTTPLMRRFGIRTVLLGSVAGSAALPGRDRLPAADHAAAVMLLGLLVLSGIFRSVGFTTYNSAAFADVAAGADDQRQHPDVHAAGAGRRARASRSGALLVRLGEPVAGAVGLGVRRRPSRSGWPSCCSR